MPIYRQTAGVGDQSTVYQLPGPSFCGADRDLRGKNAWDYGAQHIGLRSAEAELAYVCAQAR